MRIPNFGANLARSLALAAAALVVTVPADALAFCRSTTCGSDCPRDFDDCKTTGEKLFWPTMCVGFNLQEDASAHIELSVFEAVAHKSFVAWSDLDCDGGTATLAFQRLDNVACHRAEFNPKGKNANVVLIQDNRWTYHSGDNTLAKTTVTFDTDTGEILDADIELNHAYNEFTVGEELVIYDLQSILTHEIGHFIGLDHTPDYSATMNAAYEPSTIDLRTLEPDDEDAVCAAYPPSRAAQCIAAPKGGLSYECEGTVAAETGCAVAPAPSAAADPLARTRAPVAPAALVLTALAAIVLRRRANEGRPCPRRAKLVA